jgi:hypothetical protein
MRRSILSILALCLVLPVAAQEPPAGGQRPQRQQAPWDATKEVTLTGVVTDVKTQARGPVSQIVLTFKAGDKEYTVMVGPEDFVKDKKFAFAKDDKLTMVGIANESPNGIRFMAREITKGKEVLALRDKEGKSLVPRPAGPPAGN